jgi:hypothetical protein
MHSSCLCTLTGSSQLTMQLHRSLIRKPLQPCSTCSWCRPLQASCPRREQCSFAHNPCEFLTAVSAAASCWPHTKLLRSGQRHCMPQLSETLCMTLTSALESIIRLALLTCLCPAFCCCSVALQSSEPSDVHKSFSWAAPTAISMHSLAWSASVGVSSMLQWLSCAVFSWLTGWTAVPDAYAYVHSRATNLP